MPNRPNRESTKSTDPIPTDHHHGGRELPDDVQDRPEQNAGYDAAVKGEPADLDLLDLDQFETGEDDTELDDELLH